MYRENNVLGDLVQVGFGRILTLTPAASMGGAASASPPGAVHGTSGAPSGGEHARVACCAHHTCQLLLRLAQQSPEPYLMPCCTRGYSANLEAPLAASFPCEGPFGGSRSRESGEYPTL